MFKHNKADVSLTAFSDDFITNLGYVFLEAIFGETSKHGASFAIIKREQWFFNSLLDRQRVYIKVSAQIFSVVSAGLYFFVVCQFDGIGSLTKTKFQGATKSLMAKTQRHSINKL